MLLRLSDEFDLKLLRYLWTWRVSTTSAIAKAIGPNRTIFNVYRRLLTLEKQKFIRIHASPNGAARVWLLDGRGFQTIQGQLPRLSDNGYKPDHVGHDLLCHAIHLGDWIGNGNQAYNLYTEQQLRRIDTEFYPPWVPITPTHRPDGWWQIGNGNDGRLVALEVEISLKDPDSYVTLGEFYSESIKIDCTIWLINGQVDGLYIQRHLLRGTKDRHDCHSFVFLSDFIRHGWQSPIRIGKNSGHTLSSILSTSSVPSTYQGTGMVLLDVRKKPMKPNGSRSPSVSDFL